MTPVQKVIPFGPQQTPIMSSPPTRAFALFGPTSIPEAYVEPHAIPPSWLNDPRVRALSSQSFRVACYLRSGLPPPLVEQMQVIRSEIQKSGLFSDRDLEQLLNARDDVEPDVPMVRLRSTGLIPAEWNDRFLRFYKAYGMARDRGGAERAWMKLERSAKQTGIDLEHVILCASRSQREGAFRPNLLRKRPATWLNQNCWEDDIDGGEFPPTSIPLIELFNRKCPRAEKVVAYSPARSDAVRHALARMDLNRWTYYFDACAQFPHLFDFVKGPVPITTALSPEMERKVREEVKRHLSQSPRAEDVR